MFKQYPFIYLFLYYYLAMLKVRFRARMLQRVSSFHLHQHCGVVHQAETKLSGSQETSVSNDELTTSQSTVWRHNRQIQSWEVISEN